VSRTSAFLGSRRSCFHDPALCLPVPGRHGSGRRLAGSLIPDRTPWSAIGSSSKRGMICRWGWSPDRSSRACTRRERAACVARLVREAEVLGSSSRWRALRAEMLGRDLSNAITMPYGIRMHCVFDAGPRQCPPRQRSVSFTRPPGSGTRSAAQSHAINPATSVVIRRDNRRRGGGRGRRRP
jgi:hypothetical protein